MEVPLDPTLIDINGYQKMFVSFSSEEIEIVIAQNKEKTE